MLRRWQPETSTYAHESIREDIVRIFRDALMKTTGGHKHAGPQAQNVQGFDVVFGLHLSMVLTGVLVRHHMFVLDLNGFVG